MRLAPVGVPDRATMLTPFVKAVTKSGVIDWGVERSR